MDFETNGCEDQPAEAQELVGKTISSVELVGEYLECRDLEIGFTDGTRIRLEPTGYEADGIRVIDVASPPMASAVGRGASKEAPAFSEQIVKMSAEVLDKFDKEFDEGLSKRVTRFGKLG